MAQTMLRQHSEQGHPGSASRGPDTSGRTLYESARYHLDPSTLSHKSPAWSSIAVPACASRELARREQSEASPRTQRRVLRNVRAPARNSAHFAKMSSPALNVPQGSSQDLFQTHPEWGPLESPRLRRLHPALRLAGYPATLPCHLTPGTPPKGSEPHQLRTCPGAHPCGPATLPTKGRELHPLPLAQRTHPGERALDSGLSGAARSVVGLDSHER